MQASVRERAARLARLFAQVAEAGVHPAHGEDTPHMMFVLVVGVGLLRSIRVVSTSLRQPRALRAPGTLPRLAETQHWLPELFVHTSQQLQGTLLSNTGRVHQSVEVMDFGPLHWRHEPPAHVIGVHIH